MKNIRNKTEHIIWKCFFVVASLCYKTSASANRVVLDGFLTYQSLTTSCGCTLTSTQSINVGFTALNNLQPNHFSCGSSIRAVSGGNTFVINCYVSGTLPVSPTQPIKLNFEKPVYGYDSSYCIFLSPVPGKQSNAF